MNGLILDRKHPTQAKKLKARSQQLKADTVLKIWWNLPK
jgi:hypothetical protein